MDQPARTIRLISLAVICVSLIAGAAYWSLRPTCVAGSGLVGEVKREAEGKPLYFDGRCWTAKPLPPTDLPF